MLIGGLSLKEKKMKILITGAAGMLAAEVIPELLKQGHEVIQTDINQRVPDIAALDVAKLEDVLHVTAQVQPDYIFHFAAETNVDLCEKDPDHAYRINTLGTENMAVACRQHSCALLYISTGAVFDGVKSGPHTEFDRPNPVNVYGESKLQGEVIVRDLLNRYFIIRAGWMVGGWELDKKFVYKIIQQLKSGKTELLAVADKFGSPTFTKDFAANLINVLNTGKCGIYHMANKGVCSRYDMAVKIVEFMGFKDKAAVKPVSSAVFPLPAPRARSEMICNYKLRLAGLDNMPSWESSLKDYIEANKDK